MPNIYVISWSSIAHKKAKAEKEKNKERMQ
jgi:hypothetical protein